jgi:transcriptional regulator with XRE-family HTH domain
MSTQEERRALLAGFVRKRREALRPADVGLPSGPRRRTPGLRREEVAQLCRLSTTWYTWIEQGREVSLSAPALARLAEGLRLTPAERAYLFELTQRRDPAPPSPHPANMAAPDELVALVRAVAAPAYLLDPLWRICGHNLQAARLFKPWLASGEACLLRFIFLEPSARAFISDWDDRARRVVAEFRADTAHRPDDAAMQDLARDLNRQSADFAALWKSHAVLAREGGLRQFNHPDDGRLLFRQITMLPAAHPGHKLVALLPA